MDIEQEPSQKESTSRPSSSPSWNRSTKIIIVIIVLLLAALLTYRFQGLIGMLTIAAILAYLLKPMIDFLYQRTGISRGLVIVLVYFLLAVGIIWSGVVLGVATFEQATGLVNALPNIIEQATARFQTLTTGTDPIIIGPIEIVPIGLPWEEIGNQLMGLVEPAVGTSGQFISRVATTTVRTLANLLFIFVISIYLSTEIPQLKNYVDRIANQPGYQRDADRLMREFGRIWNSYLRGQIVLGIIIFLVVWIGLSLLGVRNALGLALVAGLLEFVPNLGPIISTGVAMVFAFFQPTNPFGLVGWQYALLVLALMILIQQLENNLLVPRIVGGALDLHPLLVFIGVFMGASLAGILGAVLAAPIMASLKLISIYTWRKLFDLPPFPDAEATEPQESRSFLARLLRGRLRPQAQTSDEKAAGTDAPQSKSGTP